MKRVSVASVLDWFSLPPRLQKLVSESGFLRKGMSLCNFNLSGWALKGQMVLDQRRLLIAVVTSYVCRNCSSRSGCSCGSTNSLHQMEHNSARFWTLRPCSLWPRKLQGPWSQSNRIVLNEVNNAWSPSIPYCTIYVCRIEFSKLDRIATGWLAIQRGK